MAWDPMSSNYETERQGDRVIPFFLVQAVQVGEEDGHPKYEDREFVEIRHPGDRSYKHVEEVTTEHKKRWPTVYAAFKEGLEVPEAGTPLKMWPVLTPAEVANFTALGIRVVEDLATVPDGDLHRLGHAARTYRDKAAAWLESAAKGAASVKAIQRAEAAEMENAALKKQLADLAARVEVMEEKKAKRAKEEA